MHYTPKVPPTQAASVSPGLAGTVRLEAWADNDSEPVPRINPDGPAHCPTCTCHQFDTRTSGILDLVVQVHAEVGTAYAALSHAKAILETEVLP